MNQNIRIICIILIIILIIILAITLRIIINRKINYKIVVGGGIEPWIIKKNPIIRPYYHNVYPSEFAKLTNSEEILKIDKLVSEECINDLSLAQKCTKQRINGYNVLVFPKGEILYKMMRGFITEDKLSEITEDPNKIVWYGNKYIAYLLARLLWTGINVYKAKEPLVLYDYFDVHNIKLLLYKINHSKLSKKIKRELQRYIKTSTGYGFKSTEDYYNFLYESNILYETYLYDKHIFAPHTPIYCDVEHSNIITPTSGYRGTYYNDITYIPIIINDILDIKVDGIIRRQMFSIIDNQGIYPEELLIPAHMRGTKLIRDTSNDLDWTNWYYNIKIEKPPINFIYSAPQDLNFKFKKTNFYFNNIGNNLPTIQKNPEYKLIMSYNVHSFTNINREIDGPQTLNNIEKLIKEVDPDVIALQEVGNIQELLINYLRSSGYDVKIVFNGKQTKNSMIVIGCKDKIYKFDKIDLIVGEYNIRREAGIINDHIAFVHLEIGERYHGQYLPKEEEEKIIQKNANMRIDQLKKLLDAYPNIDILVGDFNFTPDDEEMKFLVERGFTINDRTNTTPYDTRVDHILTKNKKVGRNWTLHVNYSDHLPILQEVVL